MTKSVKENKTYIKLDNTIKITMKGGEYINE